MDINAEQAVKKFYKFKNYNSYNWTNLDEFKQIVLKEFKNYNSYNWTKGETMAKSSIVYLKTTIVIIGLLLSINNTLLIII